MKDLVKELLGAAQDVLQLRQLQEVLLQGFLVGVDLLQLVLQLLKGRLPITRIVQSQHCSLLQQVFTSQSQRRLLRQEIFLLPSILLQV